MTRQMVAHIVNATLANGGGTFTRQGEDVTTGYAVAGIGPAVHIPVDDFNEDAVVAAMHSMELGQAQWIGTWVEAGEVWLEATGVYTDEDTAAAAALQRRELAYYALDRNEVVWMRDPAAPVAV